MAITPTITWACSDTTGEIGTITQAGVFTAIGPGTCTVTASAPGYGSATVQVTVVPPLSIAPSSATVIVGDTQQFVTTL